MKPGTPGFVGARLREAREARGLTLVALAQMVGVTRQAMSAYEHGELSPQPDNVHRMAAILDMPLTFFTMAAREEDESPTFFRSLAGATKTVRVAAERRLAWVGDILSTLEAYVSFPDQAVPELADGRAPLARPTIEDAATALRKAWALNQDPVHDVVAIAESNGVIVTRAEAESASIDAFSKRIGGERRPCIFLGTEKGSAARSRFDAAHELAHMSIHRRVPRNQLNTPAELKRIEIEANAFASAFLMPAESFADDLYLPTLDRMRAIKPKWRVSIAAMLHRAADLEIINEQHATRMWVSLSRRGWKRWEPGDDLMPLERPTALARAFELVLESGVQSAGQILERVPLSRREIEQLASLPPDMLGPEPARVRLRAPDSTPSSAPSEPGRLVPFRRSH